MTVLFGLYIKVISQIFHFTKMFLTNYTADQYIKHFSLKLTMIVYDFFVGYIICFFFFLAQCLFFIGQTISDSD